MYWQAKRTEIEKMHFNDKQKVNEVIAEMDAQLKRLVQQPKYELKKLGLYGDFSLNAQYTIEFPTQADFDAIKDKQDVKLAELTAFLNSDEPIAIGSLSLKLSDVTSVSRLGVQSWDKNKFARTDLTNFKVGEI